MNTSEIKPYSSQIMTIVGARPQFIKAAAVSRVLRTKVREYLVHTGQHYDDNMSKVFFQELNIPEPEINLGVGSGSHGWQTAQMLMGLEEILLAQKPDWVLVYGDTNSTLAGALAAAKLHIPIAHVEAGLRSFNRLMPEEHNRVVTDHLSDVLFCPTYTSKVNLEHEGITRGVHLVGDVMYDSIIYYINQAEKKSLVLKELNLKPKTYVLATLHRAENTDNTEKFLSILQALSRIASHEQSMIVPIHPRTRKKIEAMKLSHNRIQFISPLPYLDMLLLEKEAKVILTDSGGVQKEAYWVGVPCVTLREETEWLETVESGWNVLAGSDPDRILSAFQKAQPGRADTALFGDGRAAEKILNILMS